MFSCDEKKGNYSKNVMTFPSPTQVELSNYLSVQSWMKHPEPSHPIDNKLGDSRLQGHDCGPTKTNKQTTVRSQEASDLKRYTEQWKGSLPGVGYLWINLNQSCCPPAFNVAVWKISGYSRQLCIADRSENSTLPFRPFSVSLSWLEGDRL